MTLIKQQLTKIKLLNNENNLKQSQIEIFKQKLYDLEDLVQRQQSQIRTFQQNQSLLESDYQFKMNHAQEKIELLENLNQNLNLTLRDQQE